MRKENSFQVMDDRVGNEHRSQSETEDLGTQSRYSLDKEAGLPTCRVCQCAESDKRGDAALGFLGIITPPPRKTDGVNPESKDIHQNNKNNDCSKKDGTESGMIKFISPDGEVFICNNDVEMGPCVQPNALVELGCSCKNDLSLVHYACALKWFVNHGSTICEICGRVAKNIRDEDFKKVVASLKDYEALIERTSSGDPNPAQVLRSSGVDPDAIAAIRRQRLSEIALWFIPHRSNNYNSSTAAPQVVSEQSLTTVAEETAPAVHPATKWAVEGVGILVATGLLTVTLAWLIAPRVGKKTAKSGLHILLGGLCALTVVVFFRFFVLTRIKYEPARYWAILFVFWFLVFGIWASRTRGAHIT